MADSGQKIDILFDKYQDVAYTNPGYGISQQGPGSARPRIIGNLQIYQQYIPAIAPQDLLRDIDFSD